MEPKLSSKQMIIDILSMKSRAIELMNEKKKYIPFLKVLTEKDYYGDEDLSIPSIKELSQKTGLKYEVIRKYLLEIYRDMALKGDEMKPFKFNKVEYYFSLKGFDGNRLFFNVDSLPRIPRIGESISMPFFKAYLGTELFHVSEINHSLEDQHQVIGIYLKAGSYNLYWHFRKDQAKEEGELDFRDFYQLDDFQLKQKLNIGRYRHW